MRGQQPFGYSGDAEEGDMVCNVTSKDCMRDVTMRIDERGGRYGAEQEAAELARLTRSIVMYVLSWCVSCFQPGEDVASVRERHQCHSKYCCPS